MKKYKRAPLQLGKLYSVKSQVVFVDQLQGLDLSVVAREYGEIEDKEAAQRFGVRNIKEFSFWAWRACGVANIAMILKTECLFGGSLYVLVCRGLRISGYAYHNLRGGEDIGWKHGALCQLLRQYGMKASFCRLPISRIAPLIVKGRYVVVSMSSETGGHMMLVKGFVPNVSGGEFVVNDPYTFGGKGGENVRLSIADLEKLYLGRSVIAWR